MLRLSGVEKGSRVITAWTVRVSLWPPTPVLGKAFGQGGEVYPELLSQADGVEGSKDRAIRSGVDQERDFEASRVELGELEARVNERPDRRSRPEEVPPDHWERMSSSSLSVAR